MLLPLLLATALILTGIVVLLCLFLKLAAVPARLSDAGNPEFSIEKYRPLSRLLLDRDLAFLSAQPGYRPEIGRKLRRARRSVIRMYLRSLSRDFDRCYLAVKLALLESPEDRPDIASELLRQRLAFRRALAAAHIRLALDAAGLACFQSRQLWTAVYTSGSRLQGLFAEAQAMQA